MVYEQDRYAEDIKQRRTSPKGRLSVIEETTKLITIVLLPTQTQE